MAYLNTKLRLPDCSGSMYFAPLPKLSWLRQALTPGNHTRDPPLLAQLATLANACSQLDCILAPAVKECNVYGMQLWWGTSLASRWSSRSATESHRWTSPGSSDVRTGPTSMASNDCDRYFMSVNVIQLSCCQMRDSWDTSCGCREATQDLGL